MTNKSMISAEEASKKTPPENTPGSGAPLSDERHAHSPQLKPVIDEKRTELKKPDTNRPTETRNA